LNGAAGAENQIQYNKAGVLTADSELRWDDSLKSFAMGLNAQILAARCYAMGHDAIAGPGIDAVAIGEGCQATAFNSTAIGFNTIANGFGSVALGNGCSTSVAALNSTALGLAVVSRQGQIGHSSGRPNCQGSLGIDLYAQSNAAPVNLTGADGLELALDVQSCWSMRIRLTGVTVNGGTKRAHQVHETLWLQGPVNATLDSNIIVAQGSAANPVIGFAAHGWSATITAPGGAVARIRCDPGADHVRFFARIDWSIIGNVHLP